MSSYKHFTLEERKCLQEFLSQGYSLRKTAGFLGRNVSSVSREIKRNQSKKPKKPLSASRPVALSRFYRDKGGRPVSR